jgi:isocitrate dehydrogenase
LFLETFYEIAREYPDIESSDIIVDDLCMKLVSRPEIFQAIVLTNLQGDIVSDLCAGLVGGLGFAPSANIGDNISIFEAVHGTAPDIAGRGIANPTALLLSGILMLRYLGFTTAAANIENALLYTLSKVYTPAILVIALPRLLTQIPLPMRLLPTWASCLLKGAVVAQPDMEVKANHDHPLKNKLTVTNANCGRNGRSGCFCRIERPT